MKFNGELFETMLHMIGYACGQDGGLTTCFIDAVSSEYDPDILLRIAGMCNLQWGEGTVDIDKLKKFIKEFAKEGEE